MRSSISCRFGIIIVLKDIDCLGQFVKDSNLSSYVSLSHSCQAGYCLLVLLSKRKLKVFKTKVLYIREDLPPERCQKVVSSEVPLHSSHITWH